MIFVDSNIPMYLVGTDHPNKRLALETAELLISSGKNLVTSAEVFQEMIHRYHATKHLKMIEHSFAALRELVSDIFHILPEDVFHAGRLALERKGLSSRDCLHLAVMKRGGVRKIFTFDRSFDLLDIERLPRA